MTFNCTSLCEYSDTPAGRNSRERVRAILSSFTKAKYDIIALQEVKLLVNEQHALSKLFCDYVIFYNNRRKNTKGSQLKAGTLTAIRIPVFEIYSAENLLVEPGHSQCILLTPLDPTRAVVSVSNLRLQTGSGKTDKQTKAVEKLRKLLPPAHVRYLLGDLNFTSEAKDSSRGIPDEPPNWDFFLREFSFQEVTQEQHTWFSTNETSPCSSRIDRVYLSLPEVEWLLGTPTTRVLEEALTEIKKQHRTQEALGLRGSEGVNTHLPVGLKFFKVPDKHGRKVLHTNVFQDPAYLTNFNKVYIKPSEFALKRDPCKHLGLLKKAILKAYKSTVNSEHKPQRIHRFAVSLRAYRELSKPLPNFKTLHSLCGANEFLCKLIHWTGKEWVFTLLKAALTKALLDGVPDPVNVKSDEDPLSLNKSSQSNIITTLKSMKFILPSTRKRITCLSSDPAVEPTSDPGPLGEIIKSFWGSLWAGPPAHDVSRREESIDDYLSGYTPPGSAADLPDLQVEQVSNAILTSGNSAAGPDGIPFIAYRVSVEHASRVLHAYAVLLRDHPPNLGSFNSSTLLLLPKSSSLLVKDTRPLCINNTDNRLIARSLVILVTPTVDKIVDSAQQGFISGRVMSKHLLDLNKEFYEAWQSDEEYYVLFTDNAKAFDSIHHDFILRVLRKQGFPVWFVKTIESLLSGVKVNPVLSPHTWIDIKRGVKQGCPLSPILFVLIYDPLIRYLKCIPKLAPKAAADDLAVGAGNISTLFTDAIPRIDSFCDVSGMGINRAKSVILSSLPLEDPTLHPSLAQIRSSVPKPEAVNFHPLVHSSIDQDQEPHQSDILGYTEGQDLILASDLEFREEVDAGGDSPLVESALTPELPNEVVASQEDWLARSVLTPPNSPGAAIVVPSHPPQTRHHMPLRTRLVEASTAPKNPPRPTRTRRSSTTETVRNGIRLEHHAKRRKRKGPRLTQSKASAKESKVRSIVDKRWNPGQHPSNRVEVGKSSPFGYWEYRVSWEGYGEDHDTWEPLVNLSRCTDTVTGFDKSWVRPKPFRQTLQETSSPCPNDWKDIQFVDKTKYLGIVFSNSKDTYSTMELNFRPAMEKARARLFSYRVVLANVPLSTRILIVNVFITSLFSYLSGFLLIPFPLYWEYRALVSKAVIPYHGKGFKYEHLTMPPLLMGLRICISDLWVHNVYRLLTRSNFRSLGANLAQSLPWSLKAKDDKEGVPFYSPLFDDCVSLALMEFLGPKFLDWNGSSDLSNLKDVDIKRILVRHGLHRVKAHGDEERARYKDLVLKFDRYDTTPSSTLDHFATISPSTPNSHLEHHLLLYTNALATDKRIRHFAPDVSVHPAKNVWYPYPCYLCGVGEDSIRHIYAECGVVRGLLLSMSRDEGSPPLIDEIFVKNLSLTKPLFIMDFPLTSRGGKHGAAFLLAFNREIWSLRKDLRAGGTSLFCTKTFKKKLGTFSHLWESAKPKKVSDSKYGSSSRRTKKQKTRSFKDATRMIDSVDRNAAVAYTDGSSIGNPGPSGAGAFITLCSLDGEATESSLYYPLGHNTNNVGELWAIGMALSFVLDCPTTPPSLVVFTDSDTSLNLIKRLTFSVELEHLVEAIRALIDQLQHKGTRFFIRWVPAHVGILGNELADRCADYGARTPRSTTLQYPKPNGRFPYLLCPKPSLVPETE